MVRNSGLLFWPICIGRLVWNYSFTNAHRKSFRIQVWPHLQRGPKK